MLRAGDAIVTIRSGMVLPVADIYESSAEAAWFTMVFAAVVSVVRIVADTWRSKPTIDLAEGAPIANLS
jgi:hypothetical protein